MQNKTSTLKLFSVVGFCFLINIAFIDGLLSSFVSLKYLRSSSKSNNYSNVIKAYRFQEIICLALILALIYLVFSIFSNEFFLLRRKHSTSRLLAKKFFLSILPLIFLIFLCLFVFLLTHSHEHYMPPGELYHKTPEGYTNRNNLKKRAH